MKKLLVLLLLLPALMAYTTDEPFTECSAAFVGNRVVVDDYSPTGKCKLKHTATGTLTVQTVMLNEQQMKGVKKLNFKVAIRDKATGTLLLFSDQTYREVAVQQVLAKCRPGDHIVLLTTNNHYALPHNEILVIS
jgi:hypothetical protein